MISAILAGGLVILMVISCCLLGMVLRLGDQLERHLLDHAAAGEIVEEEKPPWP